MTAKCHAAVIPQPDAMQQQSHKWHATTKSQMQCSNKVTAKRYTATESQPRALQQPNHNQMQQCTPRRLSCSNKFTARCHATTVEQSVVCRQIGTTTKCCILTATAASTFSWGQQTSSRSGTNFSSGMAGNSLLAAYICAGVDTRAAISL